MIEGVRGFNRAVTQRVGALNDHYLGRDRPLGEARVIWEIGEQGCDVRAMRSRLAWTRGTSADCCAHSRAAGLITVTRERARQAGPNGTAHRKGRAERALLDRRSDALARSMLEPLTDSQRQRLVSAMSEVETLLTAALLDIDAVDPAHQHAQHCLREYFAELDRRFEMGFDPADSLPADPDEMRPPVGVFVVAIPSRRTDRLRRAEVPRRRTDRAQAHVGRTIRTRARSRSTSAPRPRATSRRARQPHHPTRDQQSAHRGRRDVSLRRLPRSRCLQRRAIRRPLVREAPRRGGARRVDAAACTRQRRLPDTVPAHVAPVPVCRVDGSRQGDPVQVRGPGPHHHAERPNQSGGDRRPVRRRHGHELLRHVVG